MITSYFEALVYLFLLVVTLVITMRFGHRRGVRARDAGVDLTKGLGTIEGSVMGLLGLILAFTLLNEQGRFERRVNLIVEQVNAIGTAYDQTSLLPEPARTEIRALLREYVSAHLEAFRTRDSQEHRDPHRRRAGQLHEILWDRYVSACKTVEAEYCANMLLPSLNRVEEASLSHLVSGRTHIPRVVMLLLLLLSACGGVVSGFSLAATHPLKRVRLHRLVYMISLGVTYFTIVDIEFPRWGLINIHGVVTPAFDELRDRMRSERDTPRDGVAR